jgi:mono/diheme cytochrome c family protein
MTIREMLAIAVAAAGASSTAACDWDLHRMNDQARCEPGDRRPWLPDQRCDQRAPDGTVAWRTVASESAATPRGAPAATRATILRGRDRFTRFCAPCHGPLGDGESVIAQAMVLRRPPSLLIPPVVEYPDQRIFEVITDGYGLMPPYRYQLPPGDRWAIVQFLRVLERSQRFPLAQLPASRRQEAERWLR